MLFLRCLTKNSNVEAAHSEKPWRAHSVSTEGINEGKVSSERQAVRVHGLFYSFLYSSL